MTPPNQMSQNQYSQYGPGEKLPIMFQDMRSLKGRSLVQDTQNEVVNKMFQRIRDKAAKASQPMNNVPDQNVETTADPTMHLASGGEDVPRINPSSSARLIGQHINDLRQRAANNNFAAGGLAVSGSVDPALISVLNQTPANTSTPTPDPVAPPNKSGPVDAGVPPIPQTTADPNSFAMKRLDILHEEGLNAMLSPYEPTQKWGAHLYGLAQGDYDRGSTVNPDDPNGGMVTIPSALNAVAAKRNADMALMLTNNGTTTLPQGAMPTELTKTMISQGLWQVNKNGELEYAPAPGYPQAKAEVQAPLIAVQESYGGPYEITYADGTKKAVTPTQMHEFVMSNPGTRVIPANAPATTQPNVAPPNQTGNPPAPQALSGPPVMPGASDQNQVLNHANNAPPVAQAGPPGLQSLPGTTQAPPYVNDYVANTTQDANSAKNISGALQGIWSDMSHFTPGSWQARFAQWSSPFWSSLQAMGIKVPDNIQDSIANQNDWNKVVTQLQGQIVNQLGERAGLVWRGVLAQLPSIYQSKASGEKILLNLMGQQQRNIDQGMFVPMYAQQHGNSYVNPNGIDENGLPEQNVQQGWNNKVNPSSYNWGDNLQTTGVGQQMNPGQLYIVKGKYVRINPITNKLEPMPFHPQGE